MFGFAVSKLTSTRWVVEVATLAGVAVLSSKVALALTGSSILCTYIVH